MTKVRLDHLLLERGLAGSLSVAQALIGAGKVYIGEVKFDKAGHQVDGGAQVTVREAEHPFVSRGGMKLAHALGQFGLNPRGMICLDIGSSTGGFTDVLLQSGAAKVYAVDVGHGQLDWKLRQDARVVVFEKTNARFLSRSLIPETIDWVVCDASFISLKTVLPAPLTLTGDKAILVALIKPQFEAEKNRVEKGGVVRDASLHAEICEDIKTWVGGHNDWQVLGITESPVRGPKGNIEFLICAQKSV
jgi:23S rRNA (cytidine1920-2'-O)/16S rRNA (cytidine1409-2'-O)-methyltransferase